MVAIPAGGPGGMFIGLNMLEGCKICLGFVEDPGYLPRRIGTERIYGKSNKDQRELEQCLEMAVSIQPE